MRILLFISLLFFVSTLNAQDSNKKEIEIWVGSYCGVIDTNNIKIDSVIVDSTCYLYKNITYRIKFFDKKGSCFFLKMDKNMDSVITGTYYGIGNIIKGSVAQQSPETGQLVFDSVYFYQPVKDGIWYYYTHNGKDIRMEIYNKGKLVKTKRFSVRK